MNTRPTDESPWLAEIDDDLIEQIGDPTSHVEQARQSRIEQWYEGLKINARLIAKVLPMLIKSFYSRPGGGEMSKIQFRVPFPIRKRGIIIKESRPSIFQTNSDVDLHIYMLGLDIAEFVYKKAPEGLAENEAYREVEMNTRYMEIYSLVDHSAFLMREISNSHTANNISNKTFLEDLKTLYDNALPEVQARIKDLYLELHEKHGFTKERDKEMTRIRVQKHQENKAGLRLVVKGEEETEDTLQ